MRAGTRWHCPVWSEEGEGVARAYREEHAVTLDTLNDARLEVGDIGQLAADEARRLRHMRGNARRLCGDGDVGIHPAAVAAEAIEGAGGLVLQGGRAQVGRSSNYSPRLKWRG